MSNIFSLQDEEPQEFLDLTIRVGSYFKSTCVS